MQEHGVTRKATSPDSASVNPKGGASVIVDGILVEAEAQAAQLLVDTEKELEEKLLRAKEQLKLKSQERLLASDKQVARIISDVEAKIGIEERKAELLFQQQIESRCISLAMEEFTKMVNQPTYTDILRSWIVESAIGMDADAAAVACSASELTVLNDALLRQAEKEILAIRGKAVSLRIKPGQPLHSQGVVLEADNGRLAYDNRILTRLERKRQQIRRLVHTTLFEARQA